MTIVRGVWCSKCRVRYAYHVCRDGMPCLHHEAEIAKDGINIIAPATLIYCESWRYLEGYKNFELQEIYFIYDKNKGKFKIKFDDKKHFKATYITEEDLKDKFLEFIKNKIDVYDWNHFIEAFTSLYYGGKSLTYPPIWRMKQIAKKTSPIRGKQHG